MAAYTKTTWANSPSTSSPLSAANLQHIEDFVQELSDDKYTGNGGQPPAPKATINSVSTASAVFATLFTLPSQRGIYLAQASLAISYGYSAMAIITVASDGATARLVSESEDAGIEIQLSGLDVQFRQNTGGITAIVASLANLGGT